MRILNGSCREELAILAQAFQRYDGEPGKPLGFSFYGWGLKKFRAWVSGFRTLDM